MRDWLALNVRSTRVKAANYCADCTPEYQAEMMQEDRCLHPETRFFVCRRQTEDELEIVGFREEPNRQQRRVILGEVLQ